MYNSTDNTTNRKTAAKMASQLLSIKLDQVEEDLVDFLTYTSGDLQLIARAGSGKTTALTLKIAYLTEALKIDPSAIMVLTFNNSAARDVEARLKEFHVSDKVRVRTFHALAQRIIRAHFGNSRQISFDETSPEGQRCQQILNEVLDDIIIDRYYHFCSGRIRIPYAKNKQYVEEIGRSSLVSAVNFLRARGYGLHKKFEDAWDNGGPLAATAMKVIYAYETRLKEERLLDGPSVLQAAAWSIERELRLNLHRPSDAHNVDYIFIDEFQDFSLPYKRLIDAIRDLNAFTTTQVVGDDWQAINGFAGSDLNYFTKPDQFLEDPEIMTLLRNRRSGSKIVEWGNKVMTIDKKVKNPAIPDPKNGTGSITTHRFSAFSDLNVFIDKLANLVDPDIKTVALIARKWTVGNFELNQIRKKLSPLLDDRGLSVSLTAITAHGSKGLEYDQVLMLDDGSFPLSHPSRPIMEKLISDDEHFREELCLKYVAGTRAKQILTIINCSKP